MTANLTKAEVEEAIKQYVQREINRSVRRVTFTITQDYDMRGERSGHTLTGVAVEFNPIVEETF